MGQTSSRSGLSIPVRVLLLRSTREDYLAFTWRHFAFGMAVVWLVGMGRYWDNPRVGVLQHLGAGSVVYVFILAALLWAVCWPFRYEGWTYPRVLTLVVLTSPPAAIYAVPVERWFDVYRAGEINLWFVLAVSGWRMLIWGRFVLRMGIPVAAAVVGIFLPVILIISALTYLNLEHAVVWQLMGGVKEPPTPADAAYNIVGFVAAISTYLILPLLVLAYVGLYFGRAQLRTDQIAQLRAPTPQSDQPRKNAD